MASVILTTVKFQVGPVGVQILPARYPAAAAAVCRRCSPASGVAARRSK